MCQTFQQLQCINNAYNWRHSALRWRHNGRDGVWNHQPHDYLRLFRRRSKKKNQSSASLAFVWGIHRSQVTLPHKGPGTRRMYIFDDVIMVWINSTILIHGVANACMDLCTCLVCSGTSWEYFIKSIVCYSFPSSITPDDGFTTLSEEELHRVIIHWSEMQVYQGQFTRTNSS